MNKISFIVLAVFCFAFNSFAQTEVETIIEKANRLLNLDNQPEAAIVEINKAIAIEPQNGRLYAARANFYRFTENNAEVLNDAQKAAQLSPTDRDVLYAGALVLHQTQQENEALKIADQLITLGDVNRFGWSLRIQIKMQLEDFAGAFEDVTTALELFPQENMFRQNQAVLLRLTGDPEKAMAIYNAVIASLETKLNKPKYQSQKEQIVRDLTNFLFSRAGYYLSKSNTESAQADLTKAVNYAPTDSNYYRRAKVYRELKMYAEAEADLTKSLEVFKTFDKIQILIERGDIYVYERKYDEALKDYRETLKLDATLKEMFDQRVEWLNQMREKSPNQPE